MIGRVFWAGPGLGRERDEAEVSGSTRLERREFVRRERRSSVADETEYVFRHVLVREVAYEQIPRAQRGDKHRRVADWIETLGRSEDLCRAARPPLHRRARVLGAGREALHEGRTGAGGGG